MIAEDRQTDQQIASTVGVSRRTIAYWKLRPEIKSRISEICEVAAARMEGRMERHEWLWERDCLRREASTARAQLPAESPFSYCRKWVPHERWFQTSPSVLTRTLPSTSKPTAASFRLPPYPLFAATCSTCASAFLSAFDGKS